MTYETYSYLKDLLDREITKLEKDFRIATLFIPEEKALKGNQLSGIEKASRILSSKAAIIKNMKKELKEVASSAYKNHPNPEMRKFWGLE